MPIAFINAQTNRLDSSGTSIAVNTPAGIANGNLMVTVVQCNAAVAITQPGGWTEVGTFPLINGNNTVDAWYRVASSEPASYTWTIGLAKCNIACLGYSGNAATVMIEATSGAATTSSPSGATSPVTAGANDWIIAAFADRDSSAGSTWTTPTGMTSRAALLNTGSSEGSLAVFDTNGPVAAGSYSYGSTSSTTQANTISGVIGIIPAATGVLPMPVNLRQAVKRSSIY